VCLLGGTLVVDSVREVDEQEIDKREKIPRELERQKETDTPIISSECHV
jgi:hypothetical protein